MGRWAQIAVATLVTVVFVGALAGPIPPGTATLGPTAGASVDRAADVAAASGAGASATPATAATAAAGALDRGESTRAAGTTTAERAPAQEEPLFAPQQEFDRSQFRVLVEADGDAVWTFRYEQPIDSDADRSSFQSFAERFRNEETELYRDFLDQAAALTASASETTGREMNATDFDRDAGIEQTPTREVGYVEMSFRWTNFGRVEEGQVHVGDVFDGGLYLGEQQSLVFVAGEDVQFASVSPDGSTSQDGLAASDSVTWTGEYEFADRHPRAVLDVEGAAPGAGGSGGIWMLGGGALVLVLAIAVVVLRRRELPGVLGGPSADDGRVVRDGSSAGTVPEPVEPPSTLSDDQRVLQLLHEADGRMKQSVIVDETDWSKSKVSMLLSDMEEEGLISKIQVGRENIIALEGHEPEAAGSPFDERE